MNGAAQLPAQTAAANSPRRQRRPGIVVHLISDDEEDEYPDAREQVEILRDLPIHPPPHAKRRFRRRDVLDWHGDVEVLPNNPNTSGLHDYFFDDEIDGDPAQAARPIIDVEAHDNQSPRVGLAAVSPSTAAPAPRRTSNPEPDFPSETKDECINKVLEVFGGICRDYISQLYKISKSSERILTYIVDKGEKGESYPKAKVLKRKRPLTEYEEAARKYGTADYITLPVYVEARQLM
jgi:3',5'-cyclic AMP phosphodiesterase CpdA